MEELDYVGVLAVELFETAEGLFANEIAPRVHNSGHWTQNGAATSQFENHLRAILGLPLGSPEPRGWSAMVNILGTVPDSSTLLALPGTHLHLYDKPPHPGRKLGHVNVVSALPAEREAKVALVEKALRS
jgi:5-(carboxyamino)imidazole ribonucleotide synthase